MHHNLDWIEKYLDIEYDASTFDTDPFEPQSDGVHTIFPFIVGDPADENSYVELPYTLAQDHGIFIIQREVNIEVWCHKLDWIVENGGMALVNVHPDYVWFKEGRIGLEEFSIDLYTGFLRYIKQRYEGQYWHGLPRELSDYLKKEALIRKGVLAPEEDDYRLEVEKVNVNGHR